MEQDNKNRELEGLIEDARFLILSPREVTERLTRIAAASFAKQLEICVVQSGETYRWGDVAEGASKTLVQKGELSEEVTFAIHSSAYPETAVEQALIPRLTELAGLLWGSDVRSMGGIAWKREWSRARLPASADRLRTGKAPDEPVAVLFADLDKFKTLNDQAGHEQGDHAIRWVNRMLHDLCRTYGGLPFHPSGDEFYLILPNVGLLPMLDALYQLREKIRARPFKAEGGEEHFLDLTLGLQMLGGSLETTRLEQALKQAEEATKEVVAQPASATKSAKKQSKAGAPAKKEKRRGKLSIASVDTRTAEPCTPMELARLGALLLRRARSRPTAFGDPRLGMLELVAKNHRRSDSKTLDRKIEELRQWLDIETAPACGYASLISTDAPKVVPVIAVALAVASGLLHGLREQKTLPELRVRFARDGSSAEVIRRGAVVWGAVLSNRNGSASVDVVATGRPAKAGALIGVQIGLSERLELAPGLEIPRHLLTDVVVVDDRPNSGGGLPDFWQAAVAQILRTAASREGKPHIFFWGEHSRNSQTLDRLRTTAWDVDEVAGIAGVGSETVTRLRDVVKQNAIVVDSAKDLCQQLFRISKLSAPETLDHQPNSHADGEPIHRGMLESKKLGENDGIRCKTAASAYPIIVDVLRRSETRDSTDEARQRLQELLAFKLILETPQIDVVPRYLLPQAQDMERYTNEVLLDRGGKIRSTLEKRPQIAAFKRELQSCFPVGGFVTSTRRACLVVPHEPQATGRPTPLGLISAWASPRISAQHRYTVDWVFVWRTVEAFIGLPYSLYGSIRLAQSLLAETKLHGDPAPSLKMGELTYIALSLHMRVDGVHQRIAKRIVDLSSD